jgi:hypothetical protein
MRTERPVKQNRYRLSATATRNSCARTHTVLHADVKGEWGGDRAQQEVPGFVSVQVCVCAGPSTAETRFCRVERNDTCGGEKKKIRKEEKKRRAFWCIFDNGQQRERLQHIITTTRKEGPSIHAEGCRGLHGHEGDAVVISIVVHDVSTNVCPSLLLLHCSEESCMSMAPYFRWASVGQFPPPHTLPHTSNLISSYVLFVPSRFVNTHAISRHRSTKLFETRRRRSRLQHTKQK